MDATSDSSTFVASLSGKSAIHIPKKWDEIADVVIIGSGFAGLAAAIEAKKAGSSVIVIEKRKVRGGNSMISGGVVAAAGSPLQKRKGVEDSPELLLQDMLKAGLYLNYPDLVRIVAEKSNEIVQWMINYLGVKYDDTLTQWGGHSVPRSYTTYNKSGAAIIHRQLAKLKELGVEVKTRRLLTKLLRDRNGRVKGIEIRDSYMFPNKNSGAIKYIRANKAVVLTTGGFGNDVLFRTTQDLSLIHISEPTRPY